MSNPVITPNMGLTEPGIGNTTSPTWAQDLNTDLSIVDGHNHAPGSGVQVNPSGLNINADLPFNGNNLTSLNSEVFKGAVVGTPSVLSVFTNGTDLFYKDINGNSIQLTKAGGPNAGTGNIQNLPSTPMGGAGISWVNSQSTFQLLADNGTSAANIDVGSAIIRYPGSYPTPSGNYIELRAPSSLATGFNIVFPATLPGASSFLSIDSSGNLAASIPTSQGIATGNIANGAVTFPKIQASNYVISGSSGNYTNSSGTHTVTNFNLTLVTSGRPVEVFIQGDTSGNYPFLINSTGDVQLNIFNVTTGAICNSLLQSGIRYPPSSFRFFDVSTVGLSQSFNYVIQVTPTAGTAQVFQCEMVVKEVI